MKIAKERNRKRRKRWWRIKHMNITKEVGHSIARGGKHHQTRRTSVYMHFPKVDLFPKEFINHYNPNSTSITLSNCNNFFSTNLQCLGWKSHSSSNEHWRHNHLLQHPKSFFNFSSFLQENTLKMSITFQLSKPR